MATATETLAKLREQQKAISEAMRIARRLAKGGGRDVDQERRDMAAKKTAERRAASVLTIPPCADRERRELLESDDAEWLAYYFGDGCGVSDSFTYAFTQQQRDMIAAIGYALRHGGDQAIAASRGEGKTTIGERLTLKYVLQGAADYIVILASTGPMADNILDSLNQYIVDNDRIAEDYPEVSIPVRELQGAPQRAKSQRANGARHDSGQPFAMAELSYTWCGNELIFPAVPGAPCAKSIITTRGLDAAVRGLKKRGKRPKLAIIDDPDTEDTARSDEQAAKLERRIDAAIGGLGGQRRAVGRVMLTTLQSRVAVSYKYTDPSKKQTFKGRRYRFLVKPPTRTDLWDEYVQMRLEDLQKRDEHGNDLDPEARRSHAWYLSQRAVMDAGAVVSNPNRFDPASEVSALQHYYNLIAKLGPEVVATEYDNDPPEESAIVESLLSSTRIQRQTNGFERRIVPKDCTILTAGVDVRKTALHWVVRAWKPDGTGYTLDYGVHEVRGTKYGSDEGVDESIRKAILEWHEQLASWDYLTSGGERHEIGMTLVDAGWKTDAIYAACLQIQRRIMPIMGFGKSSGCTSANFHEWARDTADKKMGDGWFFSNRGKLWLVCADADRWKQWEHDRWLTAPDKPGSMTIFGQANEPLERMNVDQKNHHAYARHITNEAEVEEVERGQLRRRWKAKSENTHWLDASYYCDVAANILGVRLQRSAVAVLVETAKKATAAPPQQQQSQPTATNSGPSRPGVRRLNLRSLDMRRR